MRSYLLYLLVMTLALTVLKEWQDKRLKWNSSDYDDITSIVLHPGQVWMPEIQILNRWIQLLIGDLSTPHQHRALSFLSILFFCLLVACYTLFHSRPNCVWCLCVVLNCMTYILLIVLLCLFAVLYNLRILRSLNLPSSEYW